MNGRKLLAAVAIGMSLLGGCGYQHTPRSEASVGPGSGIAPADCVRAKLPPGRVLDLTEKDNGKAFCVVGGVRILVFLHGTPANMWSHPRASSSVLRVQPSGIFTLMRGVTGGSFVAARLGSAMIASARCASHLRTAEPNGSACSPDLRFRVRVVVLRLR
jgi:hypothetical protein